MLQKQFLEDLCLFAIKNHLLLQFVENNWLKKYSMHLFPRIVFPFRKQVFRELLPGLMDKTKQLYILQALA